MRDPLKKFVWCRYQHSELVYKYLCWILRLWSKGISVLGSWSLMPCSRELTSLIFGGIILTWHIWQYWENISFSVLTYICTGRPRVMLWANSDVWSHYCITSHNANSLDKSRFRLTTKYSYLTFKTPNAIFLGPYHNRQSDTDQWRLAPSLW